MKLTKELKEKIDNMSYEAMLRQWRFTIFSAPIFQDESGDYFSKVMSKKCHTKKEKQKYRENPKKYQKAKMEWKKKNPLRQKEIDRRSRRKLKVDALNAYSNNNPKCTCCGETELEFLCLDHTKNDGNKHRKETGRGNTFYFWLRKHKYPKLNIQILCFNCNNSKKITGICVHKR